ncbi:MAG: hypothetical protein IKT86_04400 [Bacteroidaceae bacterium]|nr:hypothetical protein [Bacteroidaceae bacterium]
MNKNNILKVCVGLVIGFVLVSCHTDPEGKYPEYAGLKFTKDDPKNILFTAQNDINTISSCKAGDSLIVYMQVGYTGAYIYYADYVWELIVGDVSEKSIVGVVDPVNQSSLPMWKFKAPDTPGNYLIKFKAKYKFSADTAMGTIYGESKNYNKTLYVQ